MSRMASLKSVRIGGIRVPARGHGAQVIDVAAEMELAEDVAIQEGVQKAMDSRDQALASVELSLVECVKVGGLLRKKRANAEHGTWAQWLSTSPYTCYRHGTETKRISQETARKWMKLAEFAEKHSLENASSVKQAYILAGILPEADPAKGGGGGGSGNDPLSQLERAREALLADLRSKPLSERSAEDRHVLRQKLQPFVDAYEELAA